MVSRSRIALVLLSLCVGCPAAFAQTTCPTTLGSLNGWYGMLVSGSTLGGAPADKYLTGALLFDGAGHISANNVYSGAGVVNAATGSYLVNSDCTITMALTIGSSTQNYTVAVTTSNEAVGIETDSTAVATIDLQSQTATPTPGNNYTISSLNGTYAASCIGPSTSSSDVNLATFLNGAVTGTDPYNNGGGVGVANVPYTGSYKVNTDGTFVGKLTVLDTPFDFYGVISNSRTEIEYIYTNVSGGKPTAAFAACTGGSTTASPPTTVVTPVSLTGVDNVYAIANNGTATVNGGFDTSGNSFAANLLGTQVTWSGSTFNYGSATAPSAVSGGTVAMPAGSYSTLQVLASTGFGPLASQVFTVTYTDGSSTNFTQNMSDWGLSQNYPNEAVVQATSYRITPSGGTQNGPWNVYGYSFALDNTKTLQSVTLPNTRHVVVLAIDLVGTGSGTLAPQSITFPTIAAQTVGSQVSLGATASSGLTVSYTSTTTSVCTVSGSSASMVGAGTCSITASQPGNGSYAAATPVSQSFNVTGTPGSFTLAPQSTFLFVTPPVCFFGICSGGIGATDAITVKPSGGFNGTVAFTISGVPGGITASFGPTPVSAGGSTTLNLNPVASLFFGSTQLQVTGTSGSGSTAITATTTITLNY